MRNYLILLLLVIFSLVWFYEELHDVENQVDEKSSKQNYEVNIQENSSKIEDKSNKEDLSKPINESENFNEIKGISRAKDGDSIVISNSYEIRLEGVDAPEYSQKCLNKDNYEYACGQVSFNFLKNLINNKEITCKYRHKDIYKRFLSICYLGEKNINEELIKNGMAVIYSISSASSYLKDLENQARSNKIGIWQGAFLEPKQYRKKNKINHKKYEKENNQ